MPVTDEVDRAAGILAGSHTVVFLTGAGMSQESGIPTFRDAQTGLWSRFDAAELATVSAYRRNPPLVFTWYLRRVHGVRAAEPNDGHRAIAALEGRYDSLTVVTQNVDGLHARAGSPVVLELHGSLRNFVCIDCSRPFDPSAIFDLDLPEDENELVDPPTCPNCGGGARPGVVWFGETLPPAATAGAWEACRKCETLVVVGTSAQVYPAAELPFIAKGGGAKVVEINPEATPVSAIADCTVRRPAAVALSALKEHILSARA